MISPTILNKAAVRNEGAMIVVVILTVTNVNSYYIYITRDVTHCIMNGSSNVGSYEDHRRPPQLYKDLQTS
jgi:hypothetical protein